MAFEGKLNSSQVKHLDWSQIVKKFTWYNILSEVVVTPEVQ